MIFMRVASRRLPLTKRLVPGFQSSVQQRFASAAAGTQTSNAPQDVKAQVTVGHMKLDSLSVLIMVIFIDRGSFAYPRPCGGFCDSGFHQGAHPVYGAYIRATNSRND
jgi:hypothetical protein